jgi:outer membrane receptor protein involved in Fe transport
VSYEHYFGGSKGYVAAAFFYKDLTSYIFTQSRLYDFSKFTELVDNPPFPDTNIGLFNAPYNGQGGKLQGLELSASIPFELFSELAAGFGIIANASFNDSNIRSATGQRLQRRQRRHRAARPVGPRSTTSPPTTSTTASRPHQQPPALRLHRRDRQLRRQPKLRYVVGEDITDAPGQLHLRRRASKA